MNSNVLAILSDSAPSKISFIDEVDLLREQGYRQIPDSQRSRLGQYPTPPEIAKFMASLFQKERKVYRLLDAGAGVGTLTAAFVAKASDGPHKPDGIIATSFEISPELHPHLQETLIRCGQYCGESGIKFQGELRQEDFVAAAASNLNRGLFPKPAIEKQYNCAILNPPYKKISSDSEARHLLRSAGIETSNIYAGFVALAIKLLEPGGELVAITPRSFCNGPYFRPFRNLLLGEMDIRHIHLFESRTEAFADDEVLQENIILYAEKSSCRSTSIRITSSRGPGQPESEREVTPSQLVHPGDSNKFIHIVPNEIGAGISDQIRRLPATLFNLGISVSTGRVVDFRSTPFLLSQVESGTAPLIYPMNFENGWICWPKKHPKKPLAVTVTEVSRPWLIPSGIHVLVKRFSAKEERRRVAAAIFDPSRLGHTFDLVGFENHVNYFHINGRELPLYIAKGLTVYLNSSIVDDFFRQFNGHTQVNATDLRMLPYPSQHQLKELGSRFDGDFSDQKNIDLLLEKVLFPMAKKRRSAASVRQKTTEALEIIAALGLPRAQQNDRSALTLLALTNMTPEAQWDQATAPLIGITPIMNHIAEHFGKKYAPNSRETIRRFTVHQFIEAGLVLPNPDASQGRPVNSPDFTYQIEPGALELLKTFGTEQWDSSLSTYLSTQQTLREKYEAQRLMQRIPVTFQDGLIMELSPGGQNILIKEVIENFCSCFTPGGKVLYVGDTGDKFVKWDEQALSDLGIVTDKHGKMPDVVVFHKAKGWLVLVEAVTSHGPVNPKRHQELKHLFRESKAGLVFVTAFLDRKSMKKYLSEISWETEVWVAEAPGHLIHFNGERFLGPYNTKAK